MKTSFAFHQFKNPKRQLLSEAVFNFTQNYPSLKQESMKVCKEWIQKNQVYANEKTCNDGFSFVPKGLMIQVFIPENQVPYPCYPLSDKDFIHKEDSFCILNKPSGLASQPNIQLSEDSLHSALMVYLWKNHKHKKNLPYSRLVHRLDKDTSGLILLSLKASANKPFQEQFENRSIQKTYIAACHFPYELKNKEWSVENHLGRTPTKKHGFKFGSVDPKTPKAQAAKTDFKLLKYQKPWALLEVHPKTGRSHQIRVHLGEDNHPIFNDYIYNQTYNYEPKLPMGLHAWKLEFSHPLTKETLQVSAPVPDKLWPLKLSE